MKILFVTNCYPIATRPTYGIFVKEQIEALTSRYDDIDYDVFFINGLKGKMQYVKSIFNIRKQLKEQRYDLIHIHYGLAGLFLLFGKVDVPVVITLHGGDILAAQGKQWQVALSKLAIKQANETIILNDEMIDVVSGYAKHVTHLPCSVNTSLFKPSNSNTIDKDKKRIKVLFPSSRNRVVKNLPLFEETCTLLETIYGYHVEKMYLEGLSRDEVANTYNNVDLMLLTSISEGSPGVIKEAMASNLPIVSTNVGDVAVNLSNVANCYVSSTGTATDLADGADRCLRGCINGISGREKIKIQGLDDDTISEKLFDIYKRLIQ